MHDLGLNLLNSIIPFLGGWGDGGGRFVFDYKYGISWNQPQCE